MFVTWLGCYLYMRWSNVEHPLLGPPGVRTLLAARGFVGFFGLAPGYYALKYLSLSDATVLTFLSPVLVGALAFLFLKEPFTKTEALTGLTSLLGVVLIAKPTFLFPPAVADPSKDEVTPEERARAVGIALLGTFGAAGAYLLIRKIGKRANA
jgi:drug/metabolite transporter (DMT)-like permease